MKVSKLILDIKIGDKLYCRKDMFDLPLKPEDNNSGILLSRDKEYKITWVHNDEKGKRVLSVVNNYGERHDFHIEKQTFDTVTDVHYSTWFYTEAEYREMKIDKLLDGRKADL